MFVAFFVVLFLFLLPILFSLQAVGSLFVYPKQLRAVLGNRTLRRNHALEHATIVVMMERGVAAPRVAFVPFPYNLPMGEPGDQEGHSRVALAALGLLEDLEEPAEVEI